MCQDCYAMRTVPYLFIFHKILIKLVVNYSSETWTKKVLEFFSLYGEAKRNYKYITLQFSDIFMHIISSSAYFDNITIAKKSMKFWVIVKFINTQSFRIPCYYGRSDTSFALTSHTHVAAVLVLLMVKNWVVQRWGVMMFIPSVVKIYQLFQSSYGNTHKHVDTISLSFLIL
jgi:hypothetical protein